MLAAADFFDLGQPRVSALFQDVELAWDLLRVLPKLVAELTHGRQIIKGTVMSGAAVGDAPIFVDESAVLEPGCFIKGPAYIGPSVVVRHGAYVREDCILLDGSVVGHASEVKSSVFLPGARAPHFAYVGDSILGHQVNLGAGTKLSNLPVAPPRGSQPTIKISVDGRMVDTGLRKLGAILGDGVQIGCNAVLNPGALIGPRTLVYPNATVGKGYHAPDAIIKVRQNQETTQRD
jgi:NDP-sugar pyrophosphorylase family protein